MRSLRFALILSLAAVPLAARGEAGRVEVRAWGSFLHTSGTTTTDERFGLLLDGKYLVLKPESHGAAGAPVDLKLYPFLVSFDAGWRF